MERKYKSEEIVCLLLKFRIFVFKNLCIEIIFSFMHNRYVHNFLIKSL